ncbi:DUF4345 domain-containing protein [Congregibacter variabilis]|uniref:DUF4345 domain-containing protein n=1 Tax=Congregibacter variabilis TaxID=3081200 RepID=A0ABZ0I2Y8_9GAMM|nr:DUF4345 domain-containing protein [Congregibacter sp. IMCC43200]
MSRLITRTTLAICGVILGLIGCALIFSPQAFLQMSNIVVEKDPGLMSELIAPTGILLMSGAFMILGAVQMRFAGLGLVCGAIVYGSYGTGRVVSAVIHGFPSQSLITAALFELCIAALLVALLWRQPHEL